MRGPLTEGGQVVIAARDAARLAAIGQKLLAAHPGRVAWVSGDISELGEAERFVAATRTRFGRLDILVTSSAFNYTRAIVDTTEDEIDAVIRTNARGPLLAERVAARAFGPAHHHALGRAPRPSQPLGLRRDERRRGGHVARARRHVVPGERRRGAGDRADRQRDGRVRAVGARAVAR